MSAKGDGVPIDMPAAVPGRDDGAVPQAQVAGVPGRLGDTKDSSPDRRDSSSGLRRRGPGRPGLVALNARLSDRDMAVLNLVQVHRFMTTAQIAGFLFHDHASDGSGARVCRRTLSRLDGFGLLQRPLRRIGGLVAGSAASVWFLSSMGLRLINLRAGDGATGRVRDPGERFVRHYLAVADVHLELVKQERVGIWDLVEVQTEPSGWRRFTGLGGARETLKPDLYAVTATGEFEDHWFIEVDRATESVATVLRQCEAYEYYRRQGDEINRNGVFPVVVWVVPDEHRAAKLRDAIKSARGLTGELYRVVTQDRFTEVIRGGGA